MKVMVMVLAILAAGCGSPESPYDGEDGGGGAASSSRSEKGEGGAATTCSPDELCPAGSACLDFKGCYENVQEDVAAIQACEEANQEGASAWAATVTCLCSLPETPSWFCEKNC